MHLQKHTFKDIKRLLSAIVLMTLFVVASAVHVPVLAQSVIEGYDSDETVFQRGYLVSLKKDDPKKIEATSDTNTDRLHGVIVEANDAAVTLSSPEQKLFVAKTGRYEALVSDQNGDIIAGDYIAPSAVPGIGMKADKTSKIILGKALQAFQVGKSVTVSTATLKSNGGTTKSVTIGRAIIDISVGKNPFYESVKSKSAVPDWLNKISESIAGKPVSPVKIYIASGVLALAAIISGTLLYSAVRSSMVSIGRNPLGKKSIMKSLLQVIIVGFIIFITGILGVYLLLRL